MNNLDEIAKGDMSSLQIALPEAAEYILSLLSQSGFRAYVVGGCVRDYLLGRSGDDIDITTSAHPDEIKSVMLKNDIKIVETGLKHGTVTAVIGKASYEITTFRTDGDYSDNRHPENVAFVNDIEQDLARRDFTINAVAYNHSDGLIDEFGGVDDIENKKIRAVGDPDKRFNEDALRIMRAVRFASVLGFEIEEETKKALFKNKELLKNVSVERIYTELIKLLMGDNVLSVLDEYKEIIGVIIPELIPCFECEQHNPWHVYNVYGHIIHAVEAAPKNEILRLSMLLHDIGKPAVRRRDENGKDHFKMHAAASADIAEKVLKRLKVSNSVYDEVTTIVRHHQDVENVHDINLKRWLSKIGVKYTRDLLAARLADLLAHNPAKTAEEIAVITSLEKEIDVILENNEAFKISDLDVKGEDLIALGFEGAEIGKALSDVLALVVDNKLENSKPEIIKYLISGRAH